MNLHAYPLYWPEGWKRTAPYARKQPRFSTYGKGLGTGAAVERVLEELAKMEIKRDDCLISTNLQTRLDGLPRADQREPRDPGAAVYWRKTQNAPMRCMAIDAYSTVAGNLGAIAATLEAMRAIRRHGGAEILDRAFQGFAALTSGTTRPWREVLGITGGAVTAALIDARFRELAKIHHPDAGGNTERFQELTAARDAALAEVR
jgi:hypothetical protein